MGVVYKAEDTKLKRTVALKFLPPSSTAGEVERARLLREAQAAAALQHPNICTVYEIDEADGRAFIAMAYLEGRNLAQRNADGPFDISEALDIVIQVAQGLEEAHENDIVHRDIKSANIMLTNKGQAVIMDFGLAYLAGGSRITRNELTLGTTAYMSPEQAAGEALDRRTDLWSLGVVLYEMLTGRLPFRGHYADAIIYSIANEDPDPVTSLRSGIPLALERIVEKALAKRPAERYQHADDLLADLRALRRGRESGSSPRLAPREAKPAEPSIAVLPFVNMNRDEESEFFSDGITEDIIIALTKVEGLRVAARNSAFQFKGKTPDLDELGRRLKVDNVLVGSVRRAGNRLRVTVQLSNVADGYEMWSERYDRLMEDIFDIQDDISQAVVGTLEVKLVGGKKSLARRYTENVEAYKHYLRGRYYWHKRTPEAIRKAKENLELALGEDPNYAPAHSGLADCTVSLALINDPDPPSEVMPKAKQAALKALDLDPMLPEAHASLGFVEVVYGWNWEPADRELKRAIQLDPGYSTAHYWRAVFVLVGTGRLDEALDEAQAALNLEPVTPSINMGLGLVLFYRREYEAAAEQLRKTLELEPNIVWARFLLARTHQQLGDPEKAVAAFEELELLSMREGHLGYAYAVSGRPEQARKLLDDLQEPSRPAHIVAFQIALIHAGLGSADLALEWLERAVAARSPQLVWLNVLPEFDRLHSDPRFAALLEKMNLDSGTVTHSA